MPQTSTDETRPPSEQQAAGMGEEILTAEVDDEGVSAPAMQAAPTPAAPARPSSLYFVSWFVDGMVIGGLSILTYALLRLLHDGTRTATVTTLAMALAWVCNWPHFSATNFRLYHARANVLQYPMTALVI